MRSARFLRRHAGRSAARAARAWRR